MGQHRGARPSAAVVVTSLAIAFAAALSWSSPAHAADFHWNAAVSGNFFTAANWLEGSVPQSGDTAIFEVAGAPYTVTVNANHTLSGLVVNSADATVLVQGSNANGNVLLTVNNGVTVTAGTLLLQSANQGFQSHLTANGPGIAIGAAGTLRTAVGSGGTRIVRGPIVNDGAIILDQDTTFVGTGNVYLNRGLLRCTQTLSISVQAQTLRLASGLLDISGAAGGVAIDGATLDFQGGDVTGTPRIVGTGALVIGAGSGTGAFSLGASASINGDIKGGQSVLIQGNNAAGNSTILATSPVTVSGTLTLRSAEQGFQSRLNMQGNLLRVANGGTLSVEQGAGGDRFIFGSVTVDAGGTVNVSHPLQMNVVGATYTSDGQWNVTSNVNITRGAAGVGPAFLLRGGNIAISGAGFFIVDDGSFTMSGGSTTGRVRIRRTALSIDPLATAPAQFLVGGPGSSVGGTIHAGQDVLLQGSNLTDHTTVVANAPIVVDGLLTMRSADLGFQTRLNLGAHLLTVRDGGRLSVEVGTGGDRFIFGGFSVDSGGTVDISDSLVMNVAGAQYTNSGQWNINNVTASITGAGCVFRHQGGNIAITGGSGVFHVDDGSFLMTGGTTTGRVRVRRSLLDIAAGAGGAASFLLGGASSLGKLAGTIHAGQDVLLQGSNFNDHTTVVATADVVVEGLLTMRSADLGFQSRLNMNGSSLVVAPGGTLAVETGTGGDRFIFGDVSNEGTFNVSFNLTMNTVGAAIVNRGTWNVSDTVLINGSGNSVSLEGGAVNITTNNPDTMSIDNGAVDFLGGAVTGGPLTLRNTDLVMDAAATAPAAFRLGNLSTLAGTVSAGQSVLIQGSNFTDHTTVSATGPIIVAGALTMRSLNLGFQSRLNMLTHPLTIAPSGSLSVEAGSGGDRFLFGSLVNEGAMTVGFLLQSNVAAAQYVNRGTINLNAAWTITGAGHALSLEGGALNVNAGGALTSFNGSVAMLGGAVGAAGGAPLLVNSALTIDPAATGAAAFTTGGTVAGGASISGVVHAGQTVTVQGNNTTDHTTVNLPTGLVVQGTLAAVSAQQGFQSRVQVAGGQTLLIDDTGTFRTDTGSGGDRFVFGTVVNEGRIETNFPTTFQTGGSLTNAASGTIAGASTININGAFSNVGTFAPGALATHGRLTVNRTGGAAVTGLRVRLGGLTPVTQFDQLSITGTATLSGLLTVELDPGYLPNQGDTFTILTASTSVAGQFTAFNGLDLGGGATLLVQQVGATVRLVAADIPSFEVTTSTSPIIAGEPFSVTVEARDELDILDSGYTGNVLFSSTDPQATLPSGGQTFAGGDAGVRTFTGLVIRDSGANSITVTDVDSPIRRGTLSLNVLPGGLSASLSTVTANVSSLEANGFATAVITVTPKDTFGNNLGAGRVVSITTTRGTLLGSVVDVGDGRYTQTLRADTTTGSATISAVADGIALNQHPPMTFVPDVTAPNTVSLSRGTIAGQNVPLSWSASSSPDVARYRALIEDASGAPLGAIDAGLALSTTATGLAECSAHRFAVQPIDNAGNVGLRSNTVTGTTFKNGAPSSPISLNATASDSFVRLSFVPAGDCDVTSTRILRSETSGGPYNVTVATITVASGVRDVVDTLVVNGTDYFYVAVAIDGENLLSAPGAEAPATPIDEPAAAPVVGLVASAQAAGVVELSWLPPAPPDDADLVRYRVYRSTAPILDAADLAAATVVSEPLVESFDDLPAVDGTFHYAVTWLDLGDNESTPSPSVSATSDRVAPDGAVVVASAAPVGIGARNVTLTVSEAPAVAPVLRFTAPGRAPVVIALTVDAGDPAVFTGSVTVVEPTNAGNATFSIDVRDAVGNVGTTVTSGASLAVDGVRPTVSIVTAPSSPVTAGTVRVTLTASEPLASSPDVDIRDAQNGLHEILVVDETVPPETGRVFGGDLVVDGTFPQGNATFVVALVDGAGNAGTVVSAGAALVVDATPPSAPVNLVAGPGTQGRITLAWAAGVGGAARYRIYRDTSAIVEVTQLAPVAETVATTFSDLPPADGTFHYVVTALDAAGNESPPSNGASAVSDQTPPLAPSALTANVVNDTVALAWTAPPATPGGPANSFDVFRATGASLPADLTGLTPLRTGVLTTSFVDRPPAEGTFHYVVAAVDAVGLRSPGSNEASVAFDADAPRVTILGVVDGQHARVPLTPTVTIEDANLTSSSIDLDGAPFTSGTEVSAEGNHTLTATATDAGGRSTTRVARFTLDFTLPVVDVSGVTEGTRFTAPPVPVFSATDANLLLVSATLNGAPFASGTPISADNTYTLVVTARDRAGNVASVTVSFTVDLPPAPPAIARAEVSDAGIELSWTASTSTDVTEYRVLRDGQALFLGDALATTGGALPAAPATARFEVRAVDAFGQLSAPRNITVHPVRVALVAVGTPDGQGGSKLTRGTFDQLVLSVQNGDVLAHEAGPVALALDDADGNEIWDGDDDVTVTAAPNAGTPLSLVVFAPTVADDFDNELRVRLELGGGPSAPVTWVQSYPVDARFAPGRLIEPVHGALIRGTNALINVKVTNRGSASLQVVTARNATLASDELVVRLRDPAPGGFVIEVPLNDPNAGVAVGGGDQRRVATILPGLSRTFAPVTLTIPGDAPDNCVLEVESRQVHSRLGTGAALSEVGFSLTENAGDGFYDERTVSVVPPPYVATATTDQPDYQPGSVALISGVATDTATGAVAANEIVKLVVSRGGFDQTFFVRTDVDGFYSFPFFVSTESAGVFNVSATHPIVVVRENDASFIVHGLRFDPGNFNLSLSKNATFPVTFTLRNTGETALTGVAAVLTDANGAADGVTAAIRAAPPVTLNAGQSFALVVDVSAQLVAADSATFTIDVDTAEGSSRTATLNVALFGATPSPDVVPRFLDVSLLAGTQLSRTINVRNRGFGAWENVRVVPPVDVPFLSITTPTAFGLVEPNETVSFDVLLSPQSAEPSGITNTTITLESDNLPPVPVNVTATITTDAVGDVDVTVFNLLHALDPANPDFPVDGASVRLQSQDVFTLTFTQVSDATGHAVFNGVPAGRYTFVVSASGFQTATSASNTAQTGELVVEPARTAFVEVGLVESVVDIEWSVEPVNITDSYDVTLTTTFQTVVPTPAVDTVPANQVFDMGPGSTRTGQFQLVNVGIISAFDVRLTLRQDPNVDIQLAFDRIAEIPAKSSVVVPFTVLLRSGATPPCSTYLSQVDVNFVYFSGGAGAFIPSVALPASIDVRSHEADVRVEPNTIVRQTFVDCAGFPAGEGIIPPAILLTNADPVDVEICDCGRVTSAGQDLPTLRTLVDGAAADSVVELDGLEQRVQTDLALGGPPDLAAEPIDAQLDADGAAFYGAADWDDIKLSARALSDAGVDAGAALADIDSALPLLDQGLCESAGTGDDITLKVTSVAAKLSSATLKDTLRTFTGGSIRFDELHLKFDGFCIGPGAQVIAEIPIDAGNFAFGTLAFSTATGCGAERVTGCCPVSVGFVEHRVVCGAGTTTSTQSGGGGGFGGGWGGWGGGAGVSVGATTGSQEAVCTR